MAVTREQVRKIANKYGIKEVPADDPIYKEPASAYFMSRSGKSTKRTPSDSDSSPESDSAQSDSRSKGETDPKTETVN